SSLPSRLGVKQATSKQRKPDRPVPPARPPGNKMPQKVHFARPNLGKHLPATSRSDIAESGVPPTRPDLSAVCSGPRRIHGRSAPFQVFTDPRDTPGPRQPVSPSDSPLGPAGAPRRP